MPARLIAPSVPNPSGLTLAALRAALASRLGVYRRIRVSTLAAQGEAARVIISDDLRDDEDDPNGYGGYYVSVSDGLQAGSVRRIVAGGYEPFTGALTLSRPFSAPLVVGTHVELTSELPMRDLGRVSGLTRLVNEGLDRIRVEARLAFTGNGGYVQELDGTPWLRTAMQTSGLYDAVNRPAGMRPILSTAPYRIRADGQHVTLETTTLYASGQAFELGVWTTGMRLVRSGGVWGYSDAGLVDDDDETAVPLHWGRAFGLRRAYGYLIQRATEDTRMDPAARQLRLDFLTQEQAHWARAAAMIRRDEFPQPESETTAPMVTVPQSYGWPNG